MGKARISSYLLQAELPLQPLYGECGEERGSRNPEKEDEVMAGKSGADRPEGGQCHQKQRRKRRGWEGLRWHRVCSVSTGLEVFPPHLCKAECCS